MSSIADTGGMDQDWRPRLEEEIARSGKSLREISLAAGKSPSYVHGLLTADKAPSIENLALVCNAGGLSFAYVLLGAQLDPADIEILRALQRDEKTRAAVLMLLEAKAAI